MKRKLIPMLAALALFPAACSEDSADPVAVELRETEQGWQLYRHGEPYFIRGAGGGASLQRLAGAGANSIRMWNVDGAEKVLDEAHALGMTVTLGIWLEHERHGFDYEDPEQVAEQFEMAKEAVLRFRDHPALLIWGVGNEVEGFGSGDDPAVWKALNDVAAMVKELDPNHPTMTVTAELGGGRIPSLHHGSPAIDIHGVNAYGGAASVAERLREGGATKPFIITEFGPVGPWESPKTEWGAPIEQTSTEKAAYYSDSYTNSILEAEGQALGAYAFLWGHKMEGTATWFGMLLDDGSKLAQADVMSEFWSGKAPSDRAPDIEPIVVDGETAVAPGATVTASVGVVDPEGGEVSIQWALRAESGDYNTGGDFREPIADIEGAIVDPDGATVTVRMPDDPGPYRLFAYAFDESGHAATANIPLLVADSP